MILSASDLEAMEKLHRTNVINALPGFKSACLVGSADAHGAANLAIFSSVVHIGAHPPLIGFIMRPVSVPRHTYRNIRETGVYTINHVHEGIHAQAHQTSARYPADVSEFDACGLTPEYTGTRTAPYVREARIKIGCRFVEEAPIRANDTLLIVGSIEEVILPDDCVRPDGTIDLEAAGTIAVSGLDSYHRTQTIARLSYAKPGTEPRRLDEERGAGCA